jgi:hypothetical protein
MKGGLVGYPASFSQSGGRHEAALADLLLLCCLLYLQLFLVRVVRGNRFSHHGRQLASFKPSGWFLHSHDSSTAHLTRGRRWRGEQCRGYPSATLRRPHVLACLPRPQAESGCVLSGEAPAETPKGLQDLIVL